MLPEGTPLGELRFDEVYINYDGPQLFSCMDAQNRHLLAVHAPSTSDGDNWLYVYISQQRLRAVANGLVTLHAAFFRPQDGKVQLVVFDAKGMALVKTVQPNDIPPDWYPVEGEKISVQDNQFLASAENASFTNTVTATGGLDLDLSDIPSFLIDPAPMWEISREVLNYLRSKRTPVIEVARRTGRSVVDLVFNTALDRNQMRAEVLGNLLLAAQSLVEALTPPLPSGLSGASAREVVRLDALPLFPGSFGLRLDTHESYLFPDSRLVEALQRMFALLNSSKEPTAMRGLLSEYGPKATSRLRNFANTIYRSDADLSVDIGLPTESSALSTSLSHVEVSSLIAFLKEEATPTQDSFTFRGHLVGVTLKTKFFALENEERIVSGRVADVTLASMVGKTIGDQYDAVITTITDYNEATGMERVRNILDSLEPLT